MKLKEVADYLNKLLARRPEYGNDEIDGIRIGARNGLKFDPNKLVINFKTRYVNRLKVEADNRRRQAETMRKLQELSEPDKCRCDHTPSEEMQRAYADALMKCPTRAELAAVDEQFKDMLQPYELIGTERRDGAPYVEYVDVNIYRCKTCGKQFDDSAAMA